MHMYHMLCLVLNTAITTTTTTTIGDHHHLTTTTAAAVGGSVSDCVHLILKLKF